MVGSALGCAGALLQARARNRLASPDLLGRVLAPPVEVPAGVVTGLLGGPFLLLRPSSYGVI
ncbi:iron chelate uptake ABC transporter family permease subunit [Methylocaldum marinum]|uniref:iron chelate uptake ABC transporter family permease subunit n=1 Tax=Methylocaldum marinum TaxID=1432792 RepID=UPI0038CC0D6A